jgi:hypothetical protein
VAAELIRQGRLNEADLEHVVIYQSAIAETGMAANLFPADCPFLVAEIVDRDFFLE